jgi:hypothetical protein
MYNLFSFEILAYLDTRGNKGLSVWMRGSTAARIRQGDFYTRIPPIDGLPAAR